MQQIILQDTPDNIKDFFLMEEGLYKNIIFGRLQPFIFVSAGKENDNIYYSVETKTVKKRGNKFYLQITSKKGLSFKEGKLNLWFGSNVNYLLNDLELLFKFMNWNFIDKQFYSYITATGLRDLFKGKITNTKDLLRHYLKSVRLQASPDLLYNVVKEKYLEKPLFYKIAIISKDINHFLEKYQENKALFSEYNTNDLMVQFATLTEKIDWKWSANRMKQEHDQAVHKLMQVEIDHLDDDYVEYPLLDYPKEFELLTHKKRVFAEGMNMHHCLYTNYWDNIKRGTYLAFHVTLNGKQATFGVSLYNGKLQFNQCYDKRNSAPSAEITQLCTNWIKQQEPKELLAYTTKELQGRF